ncbi:MAG: hypothetical protein IAG10_12690 [Planctomycetaceae bacterium]|nr:hypothetical protein [Planctomycetaceae bacterium]
MSLRAIVICMVCVLTVTSGLRGDDSESKQLIQEGVNKARAKFDLAEERLTKALLADFDRAMESARAKGTGDDANAKRVDQLKEAKGKFSDSGTLPLPEVLLKPVDTFEHSLNAATKELEQSFDKAISAASKSKFDEFAAELSSQKKVFEQAFVKRHPPRIVARWVHVWKREYRVQFDFASDGRIIAPDGVERTWEIKGKTLILRQPDRRAPGGVWVDKCQISADGKSYRGRNQDNVETQGTLLESK